MKFLSIIGALGRMLFEPADTPSESQTWWRDPLSHPALAAMSPRELADLPFNRRYRLP
ncbi:hypothetical protein [Mesorhizobium sp. CN2-181]|uniref:hypothetical protein n=1 Tax=Mesorhizobium yinganensis TaxID=3157707 RepID=UPI0032B77497